jgi:Peptidase family M28.
MIGDSDLRIPQEGYSVDHAPEVVQKVWDLAAELGHGAVFTNENQGSITDDHVPLLAAGLRVIDVIDINYPPHHTPQDTMDKISAKSLGIVGDVAAALITRQ